MAYQLTLDDETKVTSDCGKITIDQSKPYSDNYKYVTLTFSELAEIVNWAQRNMGALVMAPKGYNLDHVTETTCPNCNGSGTVPVLDSERVTSCILCDGSGEVTQ